MARRRAASRLRRSECRTRRTRVKTTLLVWMLAAVAGSAQSPTLDYDYFKTKAQPIFLTKRPGHARCVSCHSSGTPLRLQPLAPGHTTWDEEESRKNFDAARRAVVPGSLKSRLLVHPLAEEAGGDFFHSGGKHWNS